MLYKRLLSLLLSVAMTVVLASSLIAQSKDDSGDSRDALKAQMLVVKGDEALRMDQPESAVGFYERALKLTPDNAAIKQKLSDAREMTATTGGSSSLLSDVMARRNVAKQMASHDIQKAINRSMELMAQPKDTKDFETALQAAKIAQNILDQNKGYFTSEEYRAKCADINRQLTWIDSKQREWNTQRVKLKAVAISEQIKKREVQSLSQRKKKVAELTIQVQTLRNEGKYREALHVLDQILEIDPSNFWAQDTKYYLDRKATLSDTRDAVDDLENESMKISTAVRKAEVPWYVLIRYPKDWAELTAGRKKYGAEGMADAESDRQLLEKLNMNIAKLKCPGESFEDVINFLRQYSGANFYVNWRALEAAGIERTATVTLDLKDVTLSKALELLLSDVGGGATELGYVMSSGVITISTQEELNKDKQTRVYQISDLVHRVPNFIGERVKVDAIGDAVSSGSSSSGGGGSSEGLFGDEGDSESTDTGREEENMTKGEAISRLTDLIKSTIDPNNWRPDGEIGSISTFNGNLVITQTSENHRRIDKLIAKLRETKSIQVSVESRFIVVNTGFLSQIGVDLDFYFNLNGSGSGSQITPNNYGKTFNSGPGGAGYDNNYTSSNPYNTGWSPVGAVQNSSPFANVMNSTTNVPNGLGSAMSSSGAGPGMAIAGTFLDDVQVDFLITATQAHQNTRNLTAPRLTLHNGQRAYVSVQRSQAYISGVEQVVSENATAPNPEISYVPTGSMLDVDVTVSHDRRYVTMTLRPQVVQLIEPIRQEKISSSNGASINIELPEIELQDIQTTVTVPDGGTLLIGGQKLSGEVEREMGVPVISKIPVVNRAFTNKGKIRDEQTLLILIKPKIILLEEGEENPTVWDEDKTYMTQNN